MALSLEDIEAIFAARGGEQYTGEPVTHLEHALQSALLAEAQGASDAMVTAALLHDLGHLLHDFGDTPTAHGIDDIHQYRALPFLRAGFGSDVLDPIRLHVDAKRYLCATREGYFAGLSDDSKRSLGLQGGIFNAGQAAAFILQAGAADAVRLRLWDDAAKSAGAATPPLAHFLARARRCMLAQAAGA
ncbi:MAG TPA: phosphonate degradation HD-domain oxygenase [Ramlibacter sp.]